MKKISIPPPLAYIDQMNSTSIPECSESDFIIRPSPSGTENKTYISPDIAVCDECRAELLNPSDRRFQYPFTNCTNCGPRFTIITGIPYDRPKTTMANFTMCTECAHEYENPLDRRFHAQPNACPVCGPRLRLYDNKKTLLHSDNLIQKTADLIHGGAIIAVKGLGGVHIICDATNANAVAALRMRKVRQGRPFAVMIADSAIAQQYCIMNEIDCMLFDSERAPIVVCQKNEVVSSSSFKPIASDTAPGLNTFGILRPYTPVHVLLMEYCKNIPLIITSANPSHEPIVTGNNEAFDRLADIADYFLLNDRPIYTACDDSVVSSFNGAPFMLRRSRGYVPHPIRLNNELPPMLALGSHLKNTIAVTRGRDVFLSQHVGDLETERGYQHFLKTIDHFTTIIGVRPEYVVHDLHPDYISTQHAQEMPLPKIGVQHHKAHIAAVAAEHNFTDECIGIAWDGSGYGDDGTLWGGEFFIGKPVQLHRAAYFKPFPLIGGAAAVRHPWRLALTMNRNLADSNHWLHSCGVDLRECNNIMKLINTPSSFPYTSSAGRLFDAAAAVCGIRPVIEYEGQAAIEFEAHISTLPNEHDFYSCFQIEHTVDREPAVAAAGVKQMTTSMPMTIAMADVFTAMQYDIQHAVPVSIIAGRFHMTMAQVLYTVCQKIKKHTGITKVILSGGVFQNMILLDASYRLLQQSGFSVLIPSMVPVNDGGIALGQIKYAGDTLS